MHISNASALFVFIPLSLLCRRIIFGKINKLSSVCIEGNIAVCICSEKRNAELIEIAYHFSVRMTVFIIPSAGCHSIHGHYKVNEILCGGSGGAVMTELQYICFYLHESVHKVIFAFRFRISHKKEGAFVVIGSQHDTHIVEIVFFHVLSRT